MTESDFFREKLPRCSGDFAFLIGNGINRYFQQALSWSALLSRTINRNHLNFPDSVREILKEGKSKSCLSFPEIASLIEEMRKAEGGSGEWLKKEIASCFREKVSRCALLDYAQRTQKDIITTNYDFTIEDSLGISRSPKPAKAPIGRRSLYHYLFEYFEKENSARVWHIHGHCGRIKSIRITLEDYINALNYIKNHLFSKDGNYCPPWEGSGWPGGSGCLGPFFTKPLVIVGCGLQSEEVLLRGLLLRKLHGDIRSKGRKSPIKNGGFYLSGESGENNDKKAFFEAVGIEFVSFRDYADLYDNPAWTELKR